MKSFAPKPWVLPQPVLIIGTYNENGVANAMNAAWGGQWDMKEIMIAMGAHATTENLNRNGEFTVAFATKKTFLPGKIRRKWKRQAGMSRKPKRLTLPSSQTFP